jgi:hypothetical protein
VPQNYQKTPCSGKFDGFIRLRMPPHSVDNLYQPKKFTRIVILAYSKLGKSP